MADPTSAAAPGGATWALPDSKAAGAVPVPEAGVAGASTDPGVAVSRAQSAPPVPIPLRPLGALERIDGGLRALRLAPATLLVVAAVTVIPVQLLGALVPADPAHPADPLLVAWLGRGAATTFAEDTARAPLGVALLALESIGLSIATAATSLLVVGWYHGRRRGTRDVLGTAIGRAPALVAAWLVVHAAEAVAGLALVLPALVPMAFFSVVAPAIAVEGLGAGGGLRRSIALTRNRFWLVLGACLVIAVADIALRGALSASSLFWSDLGLPAERVVISAVGIAARLVTVPMVAGAVALLYLDLRVRVEGLDLDLAAEELWPGAGR